MVRSLLAAFALLVSTTAPAWAGFDVFADEFPGPIPIGVGGGAIFIPEPSMGPGEGTILAYVGSSANYGVGAGLFSIFPNMTTPFIVGNADGILFVSFTTPVSEFQYDIGLLTAFDQPVDYILSIFEVGSVTPTAFVARDITTTGFLPFETYSYVGAGPTITGFALSFPGNVNQFAVDNIKAVPEASSLMLLAAAAGSLGLVRWARRSR